MVYYKQLTILLQEKALGLLRLKMTEGNIGTYGEMEVDIPFIYFGGF